MLPFKVIYHDQYDLNLGPHVFPSQKFRLIAEALIAEKIATREDFVRPEPASDQDMLRVHTPEWVRTLKTGTLTASEVMLLEIPYSRELVEAVWPAVRKALDDFRPELLFYVGGADPFCEDQLGGLSLTKNGLKARDRCVFEEARRRGVPVATALAGGYARRVEDTVRIHVNTILAARETAEKFPLQATAN